MGCQRSGPVLRSWAVKAPRGVHVVKSTWKTCGAGFGETSGCTIMVEVRVKWRCFYYLVVGAMRVRCHAQVRNLCEADAAAMSRGLSCAEWAADCDVWQEGK